MPLSGVISDFPVEFQKSSKQGSAKNRLETGVER